MAVHYAPPIDYQLQLEMELNQQQQQFQQQFLQQYHQVQQLGAGQHEWIHDGFVSPQGPANYQYALGLHPTATYNQNPSPNPPLSDYAASISPAPSLQPPPPRRRHPHAVARPWVNDAAQPPVSREASICNAAEDSDTSSSSDSNSSDESAYNYGAPAAASSSPAPPPRSTSSPPRSRPPKTQIERRRFPTTTTASGSVSSPRPLAAAAAPHSHSAGSEEEDDDDVPLSVISSSSTQNIHALAAVRRTKSAAPPSAASPRSGAATPLQHAATIAVRHTPKSRSIDAKPAASRREVARVVAERSQDSSARASRRGTPADSYASSARAQSPAYSNSSDDEDAPLDVLKAELQAERGNLSTRPLACSRSEGADASQSDATAVAAISVEPNVDASRTNKDKLMRQLKPGATPAQSPQPDKPPEGKRHHRSRSKESGGARSTQSSRESPESCASSLPPTEEPEPPVVPVAARERKTASYLPSGTTLPAVPVSRRRADKPRTGVQYVALADIVDNTERAQLEQEQAAADASNADNVEAQALHRKKSMRVGNRGFGADDDEPNSDAQSMLSQATASSSGGTLMETLRLGPVELLTASTEHSGSKAVVERVVPEDYGDLDQLLVDLDGIMNGSQAARRRFSLVLMRRSLALTNGLVEPADFSAQPDTDFDERSHPARTAIEFKPLEIPQMDSASEGDSLGLDDIINSTMAASANPDSAACQQLPPPAGSAALPGLEQQLAPPQPPAELTRGQKVQRALEKLELLNFRKVSVRIYVQDARRYYSFILTEYTTCEMILNDMKKSGIIDPDKTTWALFELVHHFGIERPLNHFENIMNVVESWEPRSNNYIIVKAFSHQSSLTLLGGVQQGDHAIEGMLYYRLKKSKWQKGVFRLQGHNMVYVKDGRGKSTKTTHYLTLTNCDVYTPFEPLRGAPTRFVFGLKSEMPMQMFEKPDEDYVKWFAVQTLDSLREWLLVLRLAKNQIKFCKVLERRVVETGAVGASDKSAPFKPLVDLAADKLADDAVDASAKKNSDFATELVTSINKIASNSQYNPSALVKAMELGGVDVSDFKVLGTASDANPGDANNDDAFVPLDNLFLPGSLLSKPKKTAAEIEASNKPPETDMFVKGSLLSQPRESKAMAASRAMQSIMAHDGNVFTQGSLLQLTEQAKPARPPHVGGAANVSHLQFPLVQFD
ncbi:hypothetical protein EV174_001130 [Coemansia sp. RSA 2320]|nr:hypothetical protein EV174_001130 [Coemansia sp. RSA 2320]